jgi:hypothetical protein
MGGWSVVCNVLFPIPLTFLLLLCLPMPAMMAVPVRRLVNGVLDRIIFPEILPGRLNVYQVVTLFSIFLFVESVWQTMGANDRLVLAYGTPAEQPARCTKWRYERNFWIALFSLVSWLILYRVHRITEELDDLKTQLKGTKIGAQIDSREKDEREGRERSRERAKPHSH